MPENNEITSQLISTEQPTELPSDLIPFTGSATTITNAILEEEPVFENPLPEETKELTDEEKKEIFIQQLKTARIRFYPIKNFVKKVEKKSKLTQPFGGSFRTTKVEKIETILTNVTTNQFDKSYRKKRRTKNKVQRQSRKANR